MASRLFIPVAMFAIGAGCATPALDEPSSCLRNDASEEPAMPAVRGSTAQTATRDARTLTDDVTVNGQRIVSVRGGCAHAWHRVNLVGMAEATDAEILAVLEQLPATSVDDVVEPLRSPDESCTPAAGARRLRCHDAFVTRSTDGADAVLTYDFAL